MSRWGYGTTPRPALHWVSAGVPAQRALDEQGGQVSPGLARGPAGGATPRRGRSGCPGGGCCPRRSVLTPVGSKAHDQWATSGPLDPQPRHGADPGRTNWAGWGGGSHFPAAREGAAGRRAERASSLLRPPRRSRRTCALHSPRGPVSLPTASLSAMVAQPQPARRASGAAPLWVQVAVRVLGGARAGSEPPGRSSTALTRRRSGRAPPRAPPGPAPAPPRAPPRLAGTAGKGLGRLGAAGVVGPAGESRSARPPQPVPPRAAPPLPGSPRAAAAGLVARPGLPGSPAGCGRAQGAQLGEQ